MQFTQASAIFFSVLLFGLDALALPQYGEAGYESGIPKACQNAGGGERIFQDVVQVYTYGEPELVTGSACESPCSITKAYTWTKGVSINVGGTVGGPGFAETLWKFMAGSSVNAGYSWTTSKTESTSHTLTCDLKERGIRCGVHVIPRTVKITGKSRLKGGDPACNKELGGWEDYEIETLATKTTWENVKIDAGKDGDDDVDVTFGACLAYCENKAICQKAIKEKMKVCPQADIPDDWINGEGFDPKDFSDMLDSAKDWEEVVPFETDGLAELAEGISQDV